MPNLDELKSEVAQLNSQTSIRADYVAAFSHIQEASRTITDAETAELRDILSAFRAKIPDLITYNKMRADAKALADKIMLGRVGGRLDHIRTRNELLATLTAELKEQNEKGKRDASLLTRITEAINKGTKTVEEIKELIGQLKDTDLDTKQKLLALLASLGDIKDIFAPEEEEEEA